MKAKIAHLGGWVVLEKKVCQRFPLKFAFIESKWKNWQGNKEFQGGTFQGNETEVRDKRNNKFLGRLWNHIENKKFYFATYSEFDNGLPLANCDLLK